MIWLTWRQFRVQAAAAYGLLAVAVAALLVAGRPLPGSGVTRLAPADGTLYSAGIVAVYALPALAGVFWGAPLVSRELETGTHRLVWNQGVTRTRWLVTKVAVIGLAATAAAGLLSLAVTWWAGPLDAASRPDTIRPVGAAMPDAVSFAARISPLVFGARGIVPVGHAAFAFVLGVAAGTLLRRTVPAMAVTLVVFAAVQVAVPFAVRPHLAPADRQTVTITMANISKLGVNGTERLEELAVAGPPGAWVLANETVDTAGRVVAAPSWVADCARPPGQAALPTADEACFARLAGLGYRQRLTYHPAGRFWALQGIETALFLTLAGLLSRLCVRWTRTRLP
ncbi:ABC transporter permease [Nonomuraea indica]|uniref:ABC transporter permease n=1 Tax=Nonomuraea indica TaxID=1581193 RepID=A0ABW8AHM8_9ACTN